MKILFIDTTHPLLHKELAKAGFQCDLNFNWSEEEIMQNINHYEGIVIRSRIKISKTIIDKASNLKFIARVGAGMENIDKAYATNKGITCLHAPEGNRDALAEHTLGMLLNLFNNICKANKELREGKWIREANRGVELMGKTVGLLGYGVMGSAFAKRLQGFGCKIIAYDKYKKGFGTGKVSEVQLTELFEHTDVLSIHLPLTEETRYLINDAFINKFKKPIYIVNTARGKNLQTSDLVKNMETGKVLGACLDVLEYESSSFENIETDKLPDAFRFLIKSEKVVLTPHIAGWTNESNEKMAAILVIKIKNLLNKK